METAAVEDKELEGFLKELQKDIDYVKGVLGIRWPHDTGLKHQVEALERANIGEAYERKWFVVLLYSSVFLHLVEVTLLTLLFLRTQ